MVSQLAIGNRQLAIDNIADKGSSPPPEGRIEDFLKFKRLGWVVQQGEKNY